jgi:uncharacterized membrane protein YesL
MAGFFGFFDYTKPGPGVPDDAPPKHPIIVFFEVYSRKFWDLVKLNLLFALFNLPAIFVALFATGFIFQQPLYEDVTTDLIMRFILGSVLLCIPVITVGPAQAGFTYVLRNYSREEHAFIWWDFKDNARNNLKESLIICAIDFVVVLIFGVNINFYMANGGDNLLMTIAATFLVLAFIIFVMMHMYIYPMLVTFKLNVRQLYKNALVFAVMKFLPNLGILLICLVLVFLSFYNTILGIVLFPLITLSTIGLITNSYVYPKLKRYMLDKAEEGEADSTSK